MDRLYEVLDSKMKTVGKAAKRSTFIKQLIAFEALFFN
jgi:hypothetical protein